MKTNLTSTPCPTNAVPAASGMPFAGVAAISAAGFGAQGQWLSIARHRQVTGADAKHTPGDPPRELTGV